MEDPFITVARLAWRALRARAVGVIAWRGHQGLCLGWAGVEMVPLASDVPRWIKRVCQAVWALGSGMIIPYEAAEHAALKPELFLRPPSACMAMPLTQPEGALQAVVMALAEHPQRWSQEDMDILQDLVRWAQPHMPQAPMLLMPAFSGLRKDASASTLLLEQASSKAPPFSPPFSVEALAESWDAGVLVVSHTGQVLMHNSQFLRLWHLPAHKNLIHAHVDTEILPSVCQQIKDADAFQSRVAYLYEQPQQTVSDSIFLKDNRVYEYHSMALEEEMGHGNIRAWVFRDRTLESLKSQRMKEELRQAAHIRDEFVSIASHELKTPVTTLYLQIQSALRTLAKSLSKPVHERLEAWNMLESMVGKLQRAETQLQRLMRLIDTLLDVSYLMTGPVAFELEKVDLSELVQEAAERWRHAAHQAGSRLHVEAHEAVWGLWDRWRLEQIVTHLMTNALKYGQGHPIEVRVGKKVQGTPGAALACLQVKDYGIGILPEHQGRIFERFGRVESVRQYGGLGLGLWFTRRMVEALGGHIHVESRPGQGALFTVELPPSSPACSPLAPTLAPT